MYPDVCLEMIRQQVKGAIVTLTAARSQNKEGGTGREMTQCAGCVAEAFGDCRLRNEAIRPLLCCSENIVAEYPNKIVHSHIAPIVFIACFAA